MASVYILYSEKVNKLYVGSCVDITDRINQHLNKAIKGSYTTIADDWKIYFTINDLELNFARKKESHIKRMKSKKYIQNLKKYPEMTEKLKIQYADK